MLLACFISSFYCYDTLICSFSFELRSLPYQSNEPRLLPSGTLYLFLWWYWKFLWSWNRRNTGSISMADFSKLFRKRLRKIDYRRHSCFDDWLWFLGRHYILWFALYIVCVPWAYQCVVWSEYYLQRYWTDFEVLSLERLPLSPSRNRVFFIRQGVFEPLIYSGFGRGVVFGSKTPCSCIWKFGGLSANFQIQVLPLLTLMFGRSW